MVTVSPRVYQGGLQTEVIMSNTGGSTILDQTTGQVWPLVHVHFWRQFIRIFNIWRERNRQRHELATLARDGFDFKDIGIANGLAAREANRLPWQDFDEGWHEAAQTWDDRQPSLILRGDTP
jgi:uncharacterized protein YjiS (DUF1127 family)